MAQTSRLPEITLTDPQNEDLAPNLAQSPTKEQDVGYRVAASAAERPATPVSMSGSSVVSSSGTSIASQQGDFDTVCGLDIRCAVLHGQKDRCFTGHSLTMATGRPDISPNSIATPARQGRASFKTRSNNASSLPSGGDGNLEGQSQMDPLSQVGRLRIDQTCRSIAHDPITQQIFKRTNTAQHSLSLGRRPATPDSTTNQDERAPNNTDTSSAPPMQAPNRSDKSRAETTDPAVAHKDLKKGVKAVSFLSRLMGNKKTQREQIEVHPAFIDNESATSDPRPEGNDAEVFAQPMDNMGYNPRHPQPPAYIKVRAKNKHKPDFDRLFLAQELGGALPIAGGGDLSGKVERRENGANKLRRKSSVPSTDARTVWAMEFSRDGKFMASAGVDGVLRVWAVLCTLEDRQKHESQENGHGQESERLSAPVFQSKPFREYEGHTSTILDVSWSKNNFLLSSSMDKTVRLWHVTRPECLLTFKHNDYVPSIAFHPKDDRFFLAGSLDSKLRLWSIPEKAVAFSTQLPDMITAVAFTPDGKSVVAGCLSGLCMFYETEGLRYQTQIHVRSTRGQNAKGSKITGIQAYNAATGDVKILVTSNDSRIRVYNFRDKSLELKLRGNLNTSSQIRASLSEDVRYIVCGSEDRKTYIWSPFEPATAAAAMTSPENREKKPYECFETSNTITTAVCFAPAQTKACLSRADDPLYDICNPPPVTLRSRAERTESAASSSRPPTETGSVLHGSLADPDFKVPSRPSHDHRKRNAAAREEEISATWQQRSQHVNGNIIVTADYNGTIKVFRQDCAWSKRSKLDTDNDRASSIFSTTKRSTRTGGGGGRPGSLGTKGSSRSLRDKSGEKEGRASTSTQEPGERIMRWRQGIDSTSSVADTSTGAGMGTKTSSRSISPRKSLGTSRENERERSRAKRDHRALAPEEDANPTATRSWGATPTATINGHQDPPDQQKGYGAFNTHSNHDDPLMLNGGASYLYWDTSDWKQRAEGLQHAGLPVRAGENQEGEASTEGNSSREGGRAVLGCGNDTLVNRLGFEVESRGESCRSGHGDGDGDGDGSGSGKDEDEDEDRFEEARER